MSLQVVPSRLVNTRAASGSFGPGMWFSSNAYWDGTNYQAYSTSTASDYLNLSSSAGGGTLAYGHAAAGANPAGSRITWPWSVTSAGNVNQTGTLTTPAVTLAATGVAGQVGNMRNGDFGMGNQSTVSWTRISSGTQLAFWANNGGFVDDAPQMALSTAGTLSVVGSFSVTGASNSPGAYFVCTARVGTQICLYDAGSGSCFGFGVNNSELSLMSVGDFRFRQGQINGTVSMTITQAGAVTIPSTLTVGQVYCYYVHTNDGSNGVVYADAGSLYLRSTSTNVIIDGGGGLSVSSTLTVSGVLQKANNDIQNCRTYYGMNNGCYMTSGGSDTFTFANHITVSYDLAVNRTLTVAGGATFSGNQIYIGAAGLSSQTARGYAAVLTNTGQGDLVLGGGGSIIYFHPNLSVYIQQSYPYCQFQGFSPRAPNFYTSGGFCFGDNVNINLGWDGTYIRPTNSLAFNTVGNQIVWPNGSYISGNSGYAQGSSPLLKRLYQSESDEKMLKLVSDTRLPVSTYVWPGETRRTIGFMADDVAAVLPDYVLHDEEGRPSGYNPQELTTILWGAVRALAAKVEKGLP